MKTMMITMVLFGICSLPLASSYIPGVFNTESMTKVLRACAQELLALTSCLEKDRSIIFKLETCENVLAQTFMCMSNKRNAAHAQLIGDNMDDMMANDDQVVEKRGLGRCIHRCLQGQGRMNFIQCKSMCHR